MANPSKHLKDKVALIIGGSRGIGAGICKRLADDGANIVFTYAQAKDAADALAKTIEGKGVKAMAFQVDAGSVAANRDVVAKVLDSFGRIDILVLNAVSVGHGLLHEITEEDFDRAIDVNLKGPFFIAQAVAEKMTEGGRIIGIGSVFGETAFLPGIDLYAMTKAGLAGLVKGWARDLGERGITVNCIQPGPIETEMNPTDGEFAKVLTPMTAIKRYGSIEGIAEMAAFLCGPNSYNVTGATLNNDGGMTA